MVLLDKPNYSPKRFLHRFYGEDLNVGATSVDLMGADADLVGIPLPAAVTTRNVAVKIRRDAGAAPGDWTLRLFKNDVEVATFTVETT